MDRAEVRFSEERNPRISEKEVCEVTIYGHGHIVRAKAAASDASTAVDKVVDRLEHQLSKLKGKLVSRSHSRRNGSLESPVGNLIQNDDDTDADEGHPRIVK